MAQREVLAEELDSRTFRDVMSNWATGVSVITSPGADGPCGCTANAVTSLSLDPLELLVCFDRASDTLQAVTASRLLAVNVLAHGQEQLSSRFAGGGAPHEKFAGIPFESVAGVPVLADCLATVVCEVDRMLAGGDHEIVIGRPTVFEFREELEPLIFFRNGYARTR